MPTYQYKLQNYQGPGPLETKYITVTAKNEKLAERKAGRLADKLGWPQSFMFVSHEEIKLRGFKKKRLRK
jgi:hypothetical protein